MPSTGLDNVHKNPTVDLPEGTYQNDGPINEYEKHFPLFPEQVRDQITEARFVLKARETATAYPNEEQYFANLRTLAFIEELTYRENGITSGINLIFHQEVSDWLLGNPFMPVMALFKPIVGRDNSFEFTFVTNGMLYTFSGVTKRNSNEGPIDPEIFTVMAEKVSSLGKYERYLDEIDLRKHFGHDLKNIEVRQMSVANSGVIDDQTVAIAKGLQHKISRFEYKEPVLFVV